MIRVVSLGPGDPEMITLKGVKTLQGADTIFCPITRRGEVELSRSAEMVRTLGIDQSKIKLYYLPMSSNREQTLKIYEEVALHCIDLDTSGFEVVITAEGDGGFYSSSQYIHEMITLRGHHVERVAGVPAFIDCAALAGIHIASGERALQVVPSVKSPEMLLELLDRGVNIVLMKLSQSEAVIKEFIQMSGERVDLHYIENRGGEEEFYTQARGEILDRKFPYFSILIISVR